MRLATFNAENLFSRPRAMTGLTLAEGRQVLADFAEMAGIIEESTYTSAMKARLVTLVDRHLYGLAPKGGRKIRLSEVREKLLKRSGGLTTITKGGRGEWVGWFELVRDDLAPQPPHAGGRQRRAGH